VLIVAIIVYLYAEKKGLLKAMIADAANDRQEKDNNDKAAKREELKHQLDLRDKVTELEKKIRALEDQLKERKPVRNDGPTVIDFEVTPANGTAKANADNTNQGRSRGNAGANTNNTANTNSSAGGTRLYGNMQVSGDTLIIANRVLTEDPSAGAWFCVEANGDKATYTINEAQKAAIIADLQTFQNFVEKFTVASSPSAIKVLKKGHMVRDGRNWRVTEKLEVEIV